MKEHQIIFSAPMILALLAGTKTQTRRIINPQPQSEPQYGRSGMLWKPRPNDAIGGDEEFFRGFMPNRSPFGQPGDRLWVRETCRAEELTDGTNGVRYLADNHFQAITGTAESIEQWRALYSYGKRWGATVPPIHAPRWTSRILLEKTAGRVEQLQSISKADARAEGVGYDDGGEYGIANEDYLNQNGGFRKAIESFRILWASIHGPGSWEANPWLWVEEFKRLS